jgi:thiamine kinase-like enzyme
VVKKEAEGKGRSKLINEIEWLLSIPKELKPYFSEVLEYDIESPHVFYNVPYYGSRNLREHIFMGDFNADDTILFLKDLLQWMFQNVYSRKISDAPKDWLIQKHINRVLDRLPECCEKSDELRKLINAKKIIINGKEYRNVRELYEIILNNEDFINRLNPKELVMIHGDLHFQNILLSNETDTGFILVDPRGEKLGSDIYYDIGKLLHSFHAKYDFIHSDQFKLKVDLDKDIPVTSFEFTNEYMVNIYDEIYIKFLDIIQTFEYFKKDPDWKMKAYFAEASHLCSVMTFHVGKTDNSERVMTLYLTGVILINEFFEQFMEN